VLIMSCRRLWIFPRAFYKAKIRYTSSHTFKAVETGG